MTHQLSPILLRRLLRYEPETGKLFWRARPLSMFSSERACHCWNARFAGKEAFTSLSAKGYKVGRILGRGYLAHRVIWAIQTGKWPALLVDHRDSEPANNRWGNLREATRAQNNQNSGKPARNTSGYKGVSWHRGQRKWVAQIAYKGKKQHLGYFDISEEAHVAYCEAAEKYHGEFANIS